MTLIGFAAWMYLKLAENLEGKSPPPTRPTRSGWLHTRFCWPRECLHIGIGVDLMWGSYLGGARGFLWASSEALIKHIQADEG